MRPTGTFPIIHLEVTGKQETTQFGSFCVAWLLSVSIERLRQKLMRWHRKFLTAEDLAKKEVDPSGHEFAKKRLGNVKSEDDDEAKEIVEEDSGEEEEVKHLSSLESPAENTTGECHGQADHVKK
jgi:hypothetical protein